MNVPGTNLNKISQEQFKAIVQAGFDVEMGATAHRVNVWGKQDAQFKNIVPCPVADYASPSGNAKLYICYISNLSLN